jgi:hypothetical protein
MNEFGVNCYLCKPVHDHEGFFTHEVNPIILHLVRVGLIAHVLVAICSDTAQMIRVEHYLKTNSSDAPVYTFGHWEWESAGELLDSFGFLTTFIFCSDECSAVEELYEQCINHPASQY